MVFRLATRQFPDTLRTPRVLLTRWRSVGGDGRVNVRLCRAHTHARDVLALCAPCATCYVPRAVLVRCAYVRSLCVCACPLLRRNGSCHSRAGKAGTALTSPPQGPNLPALRTRTRPRFAFHRLSSVFRSRSHPDRRKNLMKKNNMSIIVYSHLPTRLSTQSGARTSLIISARLRRPTYRCHSRPLFKVSQFLL